MDMAKRYKAKRARRLLYRYRPTDDRAEKIYLLLVILNVSGIKLKNSETSENLLNKYRKNDIINIGIDDTHNGNRTNEDGGSGSGNHGHKGVPGQRGGSAPAGGSGSSNAKTSEPDSQKSTKSETETKKEPSAIKKTENIENTEKTGNKAATNETEKRASGSKENGSNESESNSGESDARKEPEERIATGKVSATGINKFDKGFSKSNLAKHWSGGSSDHRSQYPEMSKGEYADRALKLIQEPTNENILGYKTPGGQVVRYDKTTNDFVKGRPGQGIATMFKPSDGEEYFHRRMKKEKGEDHD